MTIDTLRADALGSYGNAAAATPWIDRLAAGGLRFDNARAHNVVTLPSHANILTGRLPPDHGVRDNSGFRVSNDEETLAVRLKARGYSTSAFISAFPLDSRFGLARGFDVYDDRFVDATPRPAGLEQERRGVDTVAAARKWIDARDASAPWFVWVHLYEPHFPYTPPEPYASRFASQPYAGEVAATDAALEPLLRPILEAGASGRTLVVVTSDHGESLGEHEESTHGIFAYEPTLAVPLIVYYPALLQPAVVSATAGHADIVPTILGALKLPAATGLRGRDLTGRVRGEADDEVTYFEALSGSLNRGWAPLTGVVADGMKLIDLPIPELYDLRRDPREQRNLADERPQLVDALRRRLQTFAGGELRRVGETSEVRARLRSLGYIASGGVPRRSRYTEEDDPKRLIRYDTRLQAILGLYLQGQLPRALEQCRALVAERPDMRVALLQLAHLERESGNLTAGIAALRRALTFDPGDAETASLLASYLTAANRAGEAVALLQPYAANSGVDAQVLTALALAQARAGRTADALSTLEKARADDPSNAMLFVTTGTVQLMAGRRAEAKQAFEAGLATNPDVARAHSSLGAMAAEDGRHDEALAHFRSALAIDPGEVRTLQGVATALARGGRDQEARRYLELAGVSDGRR